MRPEDIIIRPIITEKSNDGIQVGKYTFEVNKKATKIDITITVKGKEKRVNGRIGRTSDWKKAIVTIETNPSDMKYLGKGGKEVKVSKKYKDSIDEFMGA